MQTLDFVSGLHNLLSRILPTPLVFISGYANTENVFYCLKYNYYILIYLQALLHYKYYSEPLKCL